MGFPKSTLVIPAEPVDPVVARFPRTTEEAFRMSTVIDRMPRQRLRRPTRRVLGDMVRFVLGFGAIYVALTIVISRVVPHG